MSLEQKYLWASQFLDKHYPNFVDAETVFEKRVQALLHSNVVMLDAGCGKGESLQKYRPRVKLAIGIDVSKEPVRDAAGRGISTNSPQSVLVGSLEDLPFKEETFDLITCRWVMEHLKDPKRSFHEFHRILKKDGHLVLLTTNAYNYVTILNRLMPVEAKKMVLGKLGRGESDTFPAYYRCNTVRKLRAAAAESHFKKESIMLVGNPFYLFFSKFLFRLAVMYEKLTDMGLLKGGKIHIIAAFVKH